MKAARLVLPTLLGAVTLVVLGCEGHSPVGVGTEAPPARNDLFAFPLSFHLLRCAPLPADSVTETIGPEGGALQVGPHTLSVPPGALTAPVTITAVAPSSSARTVRFEPSGLTFSQPASLTMNYANCGLWTPLLPKRIAYTTDDLQQILNYLVSVDHWPDPTVTGQLDHFSTYAVAW